MNIQEGYVQVAGQQLHYLRMGQGGRLLLAFHGYGNEAYLFHPFVKYLQKQYTIISINLPYHGKSKWDSRPLLPLDLVNIVRSLMQQEGVTGLSLMGYSMGGRVCLSIIEHAPELIEQVLLIAPDGLVFNPFYYFAMRTSIGKGIFTYTLTHPRYFLWMLRGLKRIKVLDPSRYKFLTGHMRSDRERNFLLNVWPAMRLILPTAKKVKAAIRQYNIPMHIYMGKYDRIIVPRYAYQFSKGISSVHVHILQKGHHLFDDKSVAEMAATM